MITVDARLPLMVRCLVGLHHTVLILWNVLHLLFLTNDYVSKDAINTIRTSSAIMELFGGINACCMLLVGLHEHRRKRTVVFEFLPRAMVSYYILISIDNPVRYVYFLTLWCSYVDGILLLFSWKRDNARSFLVAQHGKRAD